MAIHQRGNSRLFPELPSTDALIAQAKSLLREGAEPTLREAQARLAQQHGQRDWRSLLARARRQREHGTPRLALPRYLDTAGLIPCGEPAGGVRGHEVWEFFCACDRGDDSAARALLQRRPRLATVNHVTSGLHLAVRNGDAALVDLLLACDADPTEGFEWHVDESMLEVASDRGYAEVAASLTAALARRFRFSPDREATGRMAVAVREGDVGRVEALIANDPEAARAADQSGRTPLHLAVEQRQRALAMLLLDRGAEIEAVCADGSRAIHLALDDREMAEALLSRGAKRSVVVCAALGDLTGLRAQLESDPDAVNAVEGPDLRPLAVAVRGGHLDVVHYLLAHGADPNLGALAAAGPSGRLEFARLLLERGADARQGFVLHTDRQSPELVRLLCSYGTVMSFWDLCSFGKIDVVSAMLDAEPALALGRLPILTGRSAGDEPLSMHPAWPKDGQDEGRLAVVRLLLRHGASVGPVFGSNMCPSYTFGDYRKTELLLDHGIDPDWRTMVGTRPLHYIAAEGDIARAGLLLDHGADIDAVDDHLFLSPLACAARAGKGEMVEFLLAHGADPTLPLDQPAARPEHFARKRGHAAIAERLRRAAEDP